MARLTIERDAPPDDRGRRRAPAFDRASARRRGLAAGRAGGFAELGIAEGDEIDDARRAAVEDALARVRARLFVVRSLAVKMQSVAELEAKLAARDVPPDVAREAIERVAGYGYLDDAGLAGQLARGMQARGYGRRRAEQKLRARGLPGDLRADGARRGLRRSRRGRARPRRAGRPAASPTMRNAAARSHSSPAAASRPARPGRRCAQPRAMPLDAPGSRAIVRFR